MDEFASNDLLRYLWQVRAQLDSAMGLIDAAIKDDGDRRPAPSEIRSRVISQGPAPFHATSSDFPRVGGRGLRPRHTDFFQSAQYRDGPRPTHTREVYVGCCTGLAAMSRLLRRPVYKPGTCMAGRVWPRLRELREVGYGAGRRQGDEMVADAVGYDDWFPSRIHPRLGPSPGSPVGMTEVSLTVSLAEDLPWQTFDRAFDQRTRRGNVFDWIGTEHGRNHCAMLDVDPALLQRYTVYPGGAVPRFSKAVEICMLDTYTGADRLITIVESILVEHATTGIIFDDEP